MKEKLAAGELVLCMNLRLARSVDIAMVAKAGGYDALYVDMQHAPYSIETTATICAAALGIGITPLVRVPSHDPQWMSRVLDGGAQGVILPDVNTSAEAKTIVSACRFPPLGKRSVMGLGPALGYQAIPLGEDRGGRSCAERDAPGLRGPPGHLRQPGGELGVERGGLIRIYVDHDVVGRLRASRDRIGAPIAPRERVLLVSRDDRVERVVLRDVHHREATVVMKQQWPEVGGGRGSVVRDLIPLEDDRVTGFRGCGFELGIGIGIRIL
jgi:hypothetical protein